MRHKALGVYSYPILPATLEANGSVEADATVHSTDLKKKFLGKN